MHRIDDPTAVPTLPAPRAQGTPGYFTGGSPGSSGFAATIVRYEWLNSHQEELAHVVESAGLTLNKTDNTQLFQALNKLFVSRTLVTVGMTTIYVNPTTGNDSNNGLTAGTAFLTIQAAINAIYRNYDWNGYSCTIQLADGTYTNTGATGSFLAYFGGMPFGMMAFGLTLQGNPSNPQNVVLTSTNANSIAVDRTLMYLNGLTIRATGGTWTINQIIGLGLNVSKGGWAQCSNMRFDNTGGMFSVRSDWNGVVVLTGTNNAITGSGTWGIAAGPFGTIYLSGATLNVTGWAATNSLWYADQGRMEVVSVTFTGTATGQRYTAGYNGVIDTAGGGPNYLPGTIAGALTAGGQYV
jgi:hypothetical protein